jgi:predicted heme/steroid binding protein
MTELFTSTFINNLTNFSGLFFIGLALGFGYYFFSGESKSESEPTKSSTKSSSSNMASASPSTSSDTGARRAGRQSNKPSNFTISQLNQYKGLDGRPIYLACNGVVFDMSSHESGPTFYGKGGPYEIFSGADASVGLALMSTDPSTWTKSLVTELSASEMDVMRDWYNRFLNKYMVVGALTEGSNPTTIEKLKSEGILA